MREDKNDLQTTSQDRVENNDEKESIQQTIYKINAFCRVKSLDSRRRDF